MEIPLTEDFRGTSGKIYDGGGEMAGGGFRGAAARVGRG